MTRRINLIRQYKNGEEKYIRNSRLASKAVNKKMTDTILEKVIRIRIILLDRNGDKVDN